MTFSVPLTDPHPSQRYLDAGRVRAAVDWFDFDDPSYDPVPVIELGDVLVLTDGHTRGFLAYLAGADQLEVVRDPDRPDLNIPLYRECVTWCEAASVTSIPDLAGRVVSRETFRERWVARCHASPHHETETTDGVGDSSA